MPELPEVETIARGLARQVTGDVIESVWIGGKPEPLKSPAREIARTLAGPRIADVRRVGKHIVFDLERAGGTARDQWIVAAVTAQPGQRLRQQQRPEAERQAAGERHQECDPLRGAEALHRTHATRDLRRIALRPR